MIQFEKLRLSGFKSFVDKTELEIGHGLTGIVGPNGCGKSNLVEALRWVMGENSAKRMRSGGNGMEDVIFNGTATRPQRNFAEVSLLLNNSSLTAPTAYNNTQEIEVTRRIERDHGSLYRINGKVCRARDVQMLFADTVTGANSPALVSQGRITAIINAKPQERRLVLEESAGVSGLYVRRHEAELRLRAADQNLQRVQDLVGSMEGRYNTLKKQARQAQKYKNLSQQIKDLETTLAYLEWRIALEKSETARKTFAEAESAVANHMATVLQLNKTQAAQSEDLPALRKKEAESAAALQAHKIELQRIEDEDRLHREQLEQTRQSLESTRADLAHENQSLSESTALVARLEEEQRILSESRRNEDSDLDQKRAIKNDLEQKVLKLEQDYESFMHKTAETRAARHRLEQQINADKSRLLVADERLEKLQEDLEKAKAAFDQQSDTDSLKQNIIDLEGIVESLRASMETAEKDLKDSRTALEQARDEKQNADRARAQIESEINALEKILHADTQRLFKPALDDIRTDKGFEKALSRALGDTLMASTDTKAPAVWMDGIGQGNQAPALPSGAKALLPHVQAPAYLTYALQFIGVVESEDDGARLAPTLQPGQSIVSVDGAYWRWDGYHQKPGAIDRAAVSIEQRGRLDSLKMELPSALEKAQTLETHLQELNTVLSDKQNQIDDTRAQLRVKESDLSTAQARLTFVTEQRSGLFAQIATMEDAIRRTQDDKITYRDSISQLERELSSYDEQTMTRQADEIEALRGTLTEARESLSMAVRSLDSLQQEQGRRMARLHAIGDERNSHQNRSIRARERIRELEERLTTLTQKMADLQNRPQGVDENRDQLLGKIAILEKQRDEAADALAMRESELTETTKALKEAESTLTECRESRAHAQAMVQSAQEILQGIISGIQDHYGVEPAQLKEHAVAITLEETAPLPSLEPLKAMREKALRERDQIGPVNLQADDEAQALESELGTIFKERDDLLQAISELREGIAKLNKEAKERLMAAFDVVNGHFKELFVKLFNGGQAHLQLVESDDPLQSGLEIFAQPPGKTLQSLSLLSGGEQTLTSIALIFAMFLTTPSPICVLDEIDAPLDDANVDRVCNLLDDIVARGQTRFLIITHHRLTMARMDRLYGVTMSERGVSQLVSVDLNQQMDFLEAAE